VRFKPYQEYKYRTNMSEKFQEKYRIHSARLKNWDYSAKGSYFITICTQNREHYFGEINNEKNDHIINKTKPMANQ